MHRLRDQDPRITPALTWLDQHLAAQGSTADTVVHDEHQRQGAGVVTVRNIITSMRMISDADWPELFERISLVDDMLSAGGAFRDMDFPTRNLYRSAIEELSRGRQPHRTRRYPRGRPGSEPGAHVRRASVEAGPPQPIPAITFSPVGAARSRPPSASGRQRSAWPGRLSRRLGIGGYVGAGSIVAAVLLAIPLFALRAQGLGPAWLELARCSGLGAGHRRGGGGGEPLPSRAASAQRRCPLWNFAAASRAHLRTLIAVPTLLTTAAAIEEQIERLEVHHLASPEGELHFALLSDWLDAATQTRRWR